MKTEIRHEYPPNIEAIRQKFPLSGNEVFAWNGIIYAPDGRPVPPWITKHEQVHFEQQDGDPEGWWDRYLVDSKWRFEQELEAHRVEYAEFCVRNPARNLRRAYLKAVARRLSAPMYGRMVSFEKARRLLKS